MRAFAGIDGGASKTRARVVDGDGCLIGEGAAGPGSLTLSPVVAAENCRRALGEALAGNGLAMNVCRLVCGVAGYRQPAMRAAFERELSDVDLFDVISDGYAALLGAHRGAPGGIVVTGTGSVGLGLDEDGRLLQVGGFGPVVGDEAGGNWLGREAVRASLRMADEAASGDVVMSSLAIELIECLGGSHEEMLEWIASADATSFAELVPSILRHEADGDGLAVHLLDAAADEAGRLIRLTGKNGKLPICLLGGLAETLVSRLPLTISSSLRPPAGDPIDGALLRACEQAAPEIYS